MGNWPNCVGIYGQEHIKRALEVAAAGGYNVLMSGPPGCCALPAFAGKMLLARSLPLTPSVCRAHWHLQRQRKCHRALELARTMADPSPLAGQS